MPTPRPTRTRRDAAPQPLYPKPCDSGDPLFWLANYFRDVAHHDALNRFWWKRKPSDTILDSAFLYGKYALQQECFATLRMVIKQGQLLFAHQNTTIFSPPGVSA